MGPRSLMARHSAKDSQREVLVEAVVGGILSSWESTSSGAWLSLLSGLASGLASGLHQRLFVGSRIATAFTGEGRLSGWLSGSAGGLGIARGLPGGIRIGVSSI